MKKNIIGLAIGLIVCGCTQQRQSGADPLVGYSETGIPIRQHTFTYRMTPFPKEILPQLTVYSDCLSAAFIKAGNANNADRSGFKENWLASCADTRQKAMTEADRSLLNAGWTNSNRRHSIIDRTFDEEDASERASAQEFLPPLKSPNLP